MTETSLAVSLITTCKGRLAHLKETLPAFLAQGAGCEVIVVDYDCPEGAATWVNANHPQARVVQVRDAPIFNACKARSRGSAVATGRWLAFVDADVVLSVGFCAWLVGHGRGSSTDCAARLPT
ncbi:MAG: glycosyltransferase family 2 protein [Betaproteobacteria bacterium]|nr:glycosyltransferase family 2 protein [Betaproteobacteria bacterium]